VDVPIARWSLDELALKLVNDHAAQLMSRSTIHRILSQAALQPHRSRYWLHSDDPDFEAKVLEVARLYLAAPRLYQHGELVICVDEKTGIQALERKYPLKPMQPGRPERREYEYLRHGTRCLLGSWVVATGHVLGDVTARRTRRDFCGHLRRVAAVFADATKVHWVMDNLNTHWSLELCRLIGRLSGVTLRPRALRTGAQRRAFLTDPEHKHVIHFTPKHGSWMNQIEIWFSRLTRQLLHRGNFRSPQDLASQIRDYIAYYNHYHAQPYRWTYTGQPLAA
jgi:transposase